MIRYMYLLSLYTSGTITNFRSFNYAKVLIVFFEVVRFMKLIDTIFGRPVA